MNAYFAELFLLNVGEHARDVICRPLYVLV